MWRAFIDELDEQGRINWDEIFMDGSFTPAKRGHDVGKTKRGKGTKWMVVADGQGVPLACSVHSASKAEVKLAEETLQKAKFPEKPTPVVADKRTTVTNFETTWPSRIGNWYVHTEGTANESLGRMAANCEDTVATGSSNEQSRGSATFVGLSCGTNITRGFTRPSCT